jgi:hypothetical protein
MVNIYCRLGIRPAETRRDTDPANIFIQHT